MRQAVKPFLLVAALFGVPFAVLVLIEPSHYLSRQTLTILAKAPVVGEHFATPDSYEMRAYIVSRLTDSQLAELRRLADDEFEAHRRAQLSAGKAFWDERRRRLAECEQNPANKLRRTPGCTGGLPIGYESIGKPTMGSTSPDEIFENNLMGLCDFVHSIREARSKGCLPPAQ